MSNFVIKPEKDATVIGIDVGGTTTKIAGFAPGGKLIQPMFVRATDPVTSVYGAFGKFTLENELSLDGIDRIMMTGAGARFVKEPIFGLDCQSAVEFDSIGIGGLFLSDLKEAIVVSMGTGTAIVHAKMTSGGIETEYLGGTGVGGGTIVGLSRKMLGVDTIEHIEQLCDGGDLANVDLRISDISGNGIYENVNENLTASNFGKLSDLATRHDIALGICNMVSETIAMMSIFAARSFGVRDIVLIGNLTSLTPIRETFVSLAASFGVNFLIPDKASFGTVIGAALLPPKQGGK